MSKSCYENILWHPSGPQSRSFSPAPKVGLELDLDEWVGVDRQNRDGVPDDPAKWADSQGGNEGDGECCQYTAESTGSAVLWEMSCMGRMGTGASDSQRSLDVCVGNKKPCETDEKWKLLSKKDNLTVVGGMYREDPEPRTLVEVGPERITQETFSGNQKRFSQAHVKKWEIGEINQNQLSGSLHEYCRDGEW